MRTRYIYNGQEFESLYMLRQAVWEHQRIAYGSPTTEEEFASYGITVEIQEYDPLDEISLEAIKSNAKMALENQFETYRNSKDTYLNSSLGFKVNANEEAYNNVDGVLLQAETSAATLDDEGKVAFMDFDNNLQMLNKDQLTTLKVEISVNGSRAYGVKWQYRNAIDNATTNAEVKSILQAGFDFRPEDQKQADQESTSEPSESEAVNLTENSTEGAESVSSQV